MSISLWWAFFGLALITCFIAVRDAYKEAGKEGTVQRLKAGLSFVSSVFLGSVISTYCATPKVYIEQATVVVKNKDGKKVVVIDDEEIEVPLDVKEGQRISLGKTAPSYVGGLVKDRPKWEFKSANH